MAFLRHLDDSGDRDCPGWFSGNGRQLRVHACYRPDMWLGQLYGNALFSSGRIDEALEHYQASCAIQPRTEYCHYNIAHIFSGRGQFRDAIREYELALRYTANRDMALLCLTEKAEAQLQVGDYVAAESAIAKVLTIDPSNSAAQ